MLQNTALPKDGQAAGATTSTDSAPAPMRPGYPLAMLAGLLGALAVFCLVLLGLDRTGNLPPPAFSNSLCVDEKLNFLRETPIASPNLLIIGSSVAWRHVDSAALVNAAPTLRPLNGAFCGLFANQSVYVGNWLLDREPGIRQVVMVVDPMDFAGCWKVPAAVFNRDDVEPYVYDQAPRWGYYMRYFAPVSLLRNALSVKGQRAGLSEWDPLVFNRYGDGPLDTTRSRELLYGQPDALDQGCFDALQSLGKRLQTEGRQLMVVATPLHPQWKARYDPQGKFLADFDERIVKSLGASGALYWDADQEWEAPAASFVDAIHLRWSAAQQFSVALADRLVARQALPRLAQGESKLPR